MSTALERRWFAAVAEIPHCVLCGDAPVQVSHSNFERGMGHKSLPYYTAALCPRCHADIDNGHELSREQRRALHCLAVMRTHGELIRAGRLVLHEP